MLQSVQAIWLAVQAASYALPNLIAIQPQRTRLARYSLELLQFQDEVDDLLHGVVSSFNDSCPMNRHWSYPVAFLDSDESKGTRA